MYICGIRLLFPSSFSGSAQFSVSYTFGATQACTIFRVQAPTHNSPSVTVRRHPPRRLQRFKHHVLPTGGTDILVLSPQHLVLLASFPHLSSPPSPSLLHASARAHTCINTRQKPLPRFKNRHVYTLDTEFGQPRATRPNLFPVQKSTCLHTRYGVRSAARTHTHTHGLQTQARSDSHRQIRQGHWYYHRHSHSSFSDGIPGLHCNTHAASPPESRTNPSPYLRPSLTDRYPGIKARRQRHTGLSCTATNSFSPGQSHSFTALASRFRVHTTQRHPHRSPHSSTVHAQARTPGESSCYNRPFTTLGRGRCLANPVFGLRMHWQTLTAQAAKAPSADTLRHLGLMRRSSSH